MAGGTWGDNFFLTIPKLGLARFDVAWSIAGPQYQPRSPQVAAFRQAIWVMGGREAADGRATRIFDTVTREWHSGPDLPRELAWGAAGVVDGRLIVAGGADGRCYNNRTFLLR